MGPGPGTWPSLWVRWGGAGLGSEPVSTTPGYVQGMSDLLSPILYVTQNEVDAFWCFCGFMELVVRLEGTYLTRPCGPGSSPGTSREAAWCGWKFWCCGVSPLYLEKKGKEKRCPLKKGWIGEIVCRHKALRLKKASGSQLLMWPLSHSTATLRRVRRR